MSDDRERSMPIPAGEGNGNGSKPFGGFAIDFSGDGGASAGTEVASGLGLPTISFGAPAASPATGHGGDGTNLHAGGPHHAKVVIVGSGPAGLTAAIYAARANLEPIVLAGSAPGGQLMITSDVENYPGFPAGVQGPELMAAFREQAERFGTRLVDVDIDRVDLTSRPFGLWARGVEYRADAVIVATGASALWLGLPSEERLRGRGVSACATCDGFFFRDKEIAVVGGGDTAMEEATFLTRFASKVHLLHRRDEFRASKIMLDRARSNDRIEIHPNTAVEEVLGETHVTGLRLRDTATDATREVAMDGLFVAIGYRPNTDAFRGWLDIDEMGYLVVHDETGSKIDGVFIAGDVHDHRYRQAVTAAGDGAKAAIDAERWLEVEGIAERATATAW
jgi:thioredoxin reductase (NADPH)